MWREKIVERLKGFWTNPQTRRQHHLAMFELLETGEVSAGVLAQWDGVSPLRLCENCYTLNLAEYYRCRRCASPLRYHPRLRASQIHSHLDAAEEFTHLRSQAAGDSGADSD